MTGKHSLEDLLRLVYRKPKRRHKKRHSVNRERSFVERKRHHQGKAKAAKDLRERKAYDEQVKAFWLGERDTHPGASRTVGKRLDDAPTFVTASGRVRTVDSAGVVVTLA